MKRKTLLLLWLLAMLLAPRWGFAQERLVLSECDNTEVQTITVGDFEEPLRADRTVATIGDGTSTNYYPMPGFWGYQYDVYLYTPSAASFLSNGCTISSIAWNISSGSTNSAQMTIWVKDVDASTTLSSSNTFSSFTSGATQVYSGSRSTSTGWNTYSFSSSFSHQAGKALLVAVRGVGCSGSGGCSRNCYYTSASSTHWYKHADSSDPGTSVSGSIDGNRSNVQITYTAGASAYNMPTGSITTCSGTLYDSGGSSGSYSSSEDKTLTIYPGTSGNMVRLTFTSFETESGYDYLYIYDGTSTSATSIGTYSGTTSPGTVTATNSSGALTLRFTSDSSITKAGWAATISCVTPVIPPTVSNAGYVSISTTSVTLRGQIDNMGNASSITAGICLGTSSNPTTSNTHQESTLYSTGTYDKTFTGLTAGTKYYFRAFGYNSANSLSNPSYASTSPYIVTDNTISYTLNGGTVSSANPTSYNPEFKSGDLPITLNNPTKSGYIFTGWTGSNGSTPQTTVTITTSTTGNLSYTANFASYPTPTIMTCGTTYSATLGTSGLINNYHNGSWTEPGEEKVYAYTPPVSGSYTFTATTTSGDADFFLMEGLDYTIGGLGCWSDGDQAFTLTGGHTYYLFADNYYDSQSASYTISVSCPTFALTTNVSPSGTGSVSGNNGPYEQGQTCQLTATPTTGYTFSYWSVSGSGSTLSSTTANPTTFTMGSAAATVTAYFVLSTYQISATASTGGSTSGGGSYTHGQSVTVTATPNSGYCFLNWTNNGTVVSTSPTYTFTASQNLSLVANFINMSANSISVSGTTTICGNTATLTASGLDNSVTYKWYSDAACTQLIGTGATLTTPELFDNTTYYVVAEGGVDYVPGTSSSTWSSYGNYTYSVPSGTPALKLEVWGAQGGGSQSSGNTNSGQGGKGGYSVGTLWSPSGTLYVYVGGVGGSSTSGTASGGYNGGGAGYASSESEPGNGGGGASHIAKTSGLLSSLSSSYSSQLLIVAGGGGGGGEDSSDHGGAGGGLSGLAGQNNGSTQSGCAGGTQSSAGPNGGFGYGASTGSGDGGGGGGGFYGGGSVYSSSTTTDTYGGGGGSGYLSPSLTDAQTIAGNLSMPNPNGGTMTGREGAGYVRITPYVLGHCETDPKAVTVTVTSATASDITVGGNSTYCGSTASLSASGLSGVTYNWYSDAACTQLVGTGSSWTTPTLYNNTTYYVKAVKEGLIEGTPSTFSYTGGVQSYTVPAGAGSVKLEVWGAQGGTYSSSYTGGKGGYAVGTLNNPSGTLYVVVGGQGSSGAGTSSGASGGYNGGGRGGNASSSTYASAGSGGGGATHIATSSGTLSSLSSSSVLLVAGGGGGASGASMGGSSSITPGNTVAAGGAAGVDGGRNSNSSYNGYGGTAGTTSGGGSGGGVVTSTTTSTDRTYYPGGGGGGGAGYYGGGGGGGGSTSMSGYQGYPGSNGSFGAGGAGGNSASSATAYFGGGGGSGAGGAGYASSALQNGSASNGNVTFASTTIGSTETGHEGNGYARITPYIRHLCESDAIAVTVTVTQPSAPTNVQYSNVTSTTATITWTANGESSWAYSLNNGSWTTVNTNSVSLTGLTPNTAYTFRVKAVDGNCESSVASVSFTTLQRYTISASANPSGYGSVSGAGNYDAGSSCTLVATPGGNYRFVNWTENGSQVSTSASYTFTVNSNRTLVANFEPNSYLISVSASPSNGGTVGGGGNINYGTSCTVTATPATGWHFVNWTEGATVVSSQASYTFTVNGARTLVANFAQSNYTLTINYVYCDGSQAVTSYSNNQMLYNQSYSQPSPSITGFTPDQTTVSGTMPASNHTVTVNYSVNAPTAVTVSSHTSTTATITWTGNGATSWKYSIDNGTTWTTVNTNSASLTGLTPNTAYTFQVKAVNGNCESTVASVQFTTLQQYTVSVSANPSAGGTLAGGGTYDAGDNATVTATPATGYSFVDWTENGVQVSTSASYTINNIGANHTLVANFTTVSYNITYTDDGNGTCTGPATANYGTTVNVTVSPNQGYELASLTYNGTTITPVGGVYSFTMPASAVTVHATFRMIDYTITYTNDGNGSCTGPATANLGDNVSVTVTPNTGYQLASLTYTPAGGSAVDITSAMQFTMPASAVTVHATFTKIDYAITYVPSQSNPSNGCYISGSATANYLDNVTVSVTEATGYHLVSMSYNDGSDHTITPVGGVYSFTMPASAVTVTATFAINTYTITVNANPAAYGSVSGGGTYNYGASCTVEATADAGYAFDNWTEGGSVVSGAGATYTFTVTGARSLTANFIVTPPTVTLTSFTPNTTYVDASGNVVDNGYTIIETGFCWSTSPNPVVGEPGVGRYAAGSGAGNFSCQSITTMGLGSNTHYYLRAYAVDNNSNYYYSADQEFYTLVDVTTAAASNVHTIDATLNGSYATGGDGTISGLGFVYDTIANPTIGGHGTQVTLQSPYNTPFSANVTGLKGNKTYYVRAYATNNSGTSYGAELPFTTDRYYAVVTNVNPSDGGSVTYNPAGDGYGSLSNEATIGSGATQQRNFPIVANQSNSYCEMLYRRTSDMVAGDITHISFHNLDNSTGAVSHDVRIYLKEVTNTTLSGILGVTSADLCYTGTMSGAAGGWATITLDSAFTYHGTSNLLVAVQYDGANGVSGRRTWYSTSPGYTCCQGYYGSTVNPYSPATNTTAITTDNNLLPDTKFTIRAANGHAEWYHYGASTTLTATANRGYEFVNWTESGNPVSTDTCYVVSNITANRTLQANFRLLYKRFVVDGAWNVAANWLPTGVPTASDDVVIEANDTIPSGCVAEVNNILSIADTASLTIADGGQLRHNNAANDPVTLTIERYITGYDSVNYYNNLVYHLYSSPINVDTAHFANSTYGFEDPNQNFFHFDYANTVGGELLEWVNDFPGNVHKANLVRNRGYIYASLHTTTLGVTGPVLASSDNDTVQLAYTSGSTLRFNGWNLIGNPFVCNAYVRSMSGGTATPLNFYVLNSAGSDFILGNVNYIAPTGAVMVQATTSGETVEFSRDAFGNGGRDGLLDIAVAPRQVQPDRSGLGLLDRARIRFGEGNNFEKFQLDPRHTRVYIPRSGKDYSVVYAQPIGVIPVNFMAESNGDYTISVSANEVTFTYLHLIDNRTGVDVDLLAHPEYTFSARTTDYETRFKIVFATTEAGEEEGTGNFAFYSNGTWMVYCDGEATMQVIDVLGHVLSSERISGTVSKAIHAAPGVYMIRLIQGDNVKTQKVVVEKW